jgi:hypothetical protein
MQINVKRIEARIQKLQEIRRIAADPELLDLLLEFLGNEEEAPQYAPAAKPHAVATAPSQDDIDIVDQVLNAKEARPGPSWAAKRA